eukprot:TRINITY_DN83007_c0_g1_i1.p1 TRINITY_DN83007_c0_g1~~TRINITY_DN83007_c0_g1_i1.p1  ORF type:complete len:736 (-),score=142.10 TRINITY_DN83007_c0_g1_i1:15-2222(-)
MSLPFRELLKQLVAVHEEHENEIAQLRTENALLHEQLGGKVLAATEALGICEVPETPKCIDEEAETKGTPEALFQTADEHDPDEASQVALLPGVSGKTLGSDTKGDVPPQAHGSATDQEMNVHIELRHVWDRQTRASHMVLKDLYKSRQLTDAWRDDDEQCLADSKKTSVKKGTAEEEKPARFILTPNDSKRVCWDIAGMVLLCYDMLSIPLSAFEPDDVPFTIVMDWITQLFWTGDMVMSCLTGFISEGEIVMSPRLIFINYLKTWFVLDLIVNGPDWFATFVAMGAGDQNSGTDNTTDVGRLLRSLRVVRTVRLLRLVKLKRILAMIKDRITSEAVFILLNILKLIVMLLLVNHFIAAMWYAVGGLGERGKGNNWRDTYDMTKEQADLGYRYATSLHWSLTQFTPASVEVQPQNIYERSFAIMVLVAGLVLFSSFISSITGSMSQLRNMEADKSKQFWLLRRYLKQQEVPFKIAFRVLRYIEYVNSSEQGHQVPESRITILNSLTEQLRNELRYVTQYSIMIDIAVFRQIYYLNEVILHTLVGNALSKKMFADEDPIFSEGEVSRYMYVIKKGSLRYTALNGLKIEDLRKTATGEPIVEPENHRIRVVSERDHLCEIALWANWSHTGRAKAFGDAELVFLDAQLFVNTVLKERDVCEMLTVYAKKFILCLRSEKVSPLFWELSTEEAKEFNNEFFKDDLDATSSLPAKKNRAKSWFSRDGRSKIKVSVESVED